MARPRFHILRDGDALTLCRHMPPRLDLAVRTVLPRANPLVLAQQIRQDLWRVLQAVRGFSPVVTLSPSAGEWRVAAGGRVLGQVPQAVLHRAQGVLDNPCNRARWISHARRFR